MTRSTSCVPLLRWTFSLVELIAEPCAVLLSAIPFIPTTPRLVGPGNGAKFPWGPPLSVGSSAPPAEFAERREPGVAVCKMLLISFGPGVTVNLPCLAPPGH